LVQFAGHEDLYRAGARFRDECLATSGSLFAPGTALWTPELLDEMDRQVLSKPDLAAGKFMPKLEAQLAGAGPELVQLTAEALFVVLLIEHPKSTGPAEKQSQIEEILSWESGTASFPEDLRDALPQGVVNIGAGKAYKWFQWKYVIDFVRRWWQLPASGRQAALEDPWQFKAVTHSEPAPRAQGQRAALQYLVWPDYFEDVTSKTTKEQIAEGFPGIAADVEDLDKRLLRIRTELTPKYGEGFSFFSPKLQDLWREPWKPFIEWAAKIHASPTYVSEEIDYKHTIAENARQVRRAVLAGEGDWISAMKRALGPPNNLTSWRTHFHFLRWCTEHEGEARSALRELWSSPGDPLVALERFARAVPDSYIAGVGTRTRMFTFLLLAVDVAEFPVYLDNFYLKLYKLVDYPMPEKRAGEIAIYRHSLAFLDEFRKRARDRGLDLSNRLDAAAVSYVLATGEPPEEWSPEEKEAFRQYVGQPIEIADPPGTEVPPRADDPLARLAQDLLVPRESLAEMAELLADKGQVIFYGPPGTGKTYIARRLAAHLCGDPERVELVQFHPSYAYEDFVEGYRPSAEGGSGFALTPGPLKRLARRAQDDPDHTYVLVIDEINRGSVARVFGELYFLLDYRSESITLQYSAERFQLPGNLRIIATMNTADRSIGLLDAALRRRFYFFGFFPDTDPVKGLLRRWLDRHHPDLGWVADRVDRANDQLKDRDAAVGPSYFMSKNTELNARWVEVIWQRSVLPYIEERLFGERERLASFTLDALGRATAGEPIPLESDANADVPGDGMPAV
jgi:5-methylcytosine-specific restriction protein B